MRAIARTELVFMAQGHFGQFVVQARRESIASDQSGLMYANDPTGMQEILGLVWSIVWRDRNWYAATGVREISQLVWLWRDCNWYARDIVAGLVYSMQEILHGWFGPYCGHKAGKYGLISNALI